jgi:hypothetical protein
LKLSRHIVEAFVALIVGASAALGQNLQSPTAEQVSPSFSREQLDQMLAPIALYPDPLLADILMAATYPLEVVEADRWIQDPAHAKLDRDRLTAVLEQEPWDPSVKSLVPFSQVLKMMDFNLEWTERLGEAFLADQAGVMDSIQRLREEAKAAGNLSSTLQQTVTIESEGQPITIEPSDSESVYVPDYSPSVVYGTWPYPSYPPMSFPGFLGGDIVVFVVAPFRHWHHWDWVHHRIEIDRDRFAILNRNHQPLGGATWEHDPLHRQGAAYRVPAVRARFDGHNAAPEVRVLRGFPTIGTPEVQPALRAVGQPEISQPQVSQPQISQPKVLKPALIPHTSPTSEFVNRGSGPHMGRQVTVGRVAPAGRAATNGGGVRVSPYGLQR